MTLWVHALALVALLYGIHLLRSEYASEGIRHFLLRLVGGLLSAFGGNILLQALFGLFGQSEPGLITVILLLGCLWPALQAARTLVMPRP